MVRKLLFLFLTIIIILLFVSIIRYFVSNKKSKKVFNQKVNTKENKNIIIKADFESQILTFTYRAFKEDKQQLVSSSFRFDQFIESLNLKDQITFQEFLFNSIKEDKNRNKISINCSKILNEPDIYYLNLSIMEIVDNKTVFFKGARVNQESVVKDRQNYNHLSLNSVKAKINELHPEVNGPIGSLYYFSFGNMDFYQKRYGKEVANNYLFSLWDQLVELFMNKGIVGHVKGDRFIAFFDRKSGLKDVSYYAHNNISQYEFSFEVDGTVRYFKPYLATITYGEFAKDFDGNMECLDQLMYKLENTNSPSRSRSYDSALFDELTENKNYQDSFFDTMNNEVFNPLNYPVLSLNSGLPYGFFTDYDLSNFRSREAYDILYRPINQSNDDSFVKLMNNWFNSFLSRANVNEQKFFVYVNFDMIDTLISTYTSNDEYAKINVVAVITEYSDILRNPDLTRDRINKLKTASISLGIVASADLQSVLSQELHHFSYLILPRELTKGIVNNPRMNLVLTTILDITKPYYMDKIAMDIDNYQEAEVLKENEVYYMSGSLFDPKKSNISMRTLSKLYDDNN